MKIRRKGAAETGMGRGANFCEMLRAIIKGYRRFLGPWEQSYQYEYPLCVLHDEKQKTKKNAFHINIYAVIDGAAFLGERPNQSGGAHPRWGHNALPRKHTKTTKKQKKLGTKQKTNHKKSS